MRKSALTLAVSLLIVLAGAVTVVLAQTAARALLQSVQGSVKVQRIATGAWQEVTTRADQTLFGGDHVLTLQRAAATVLIDGAKIRLGANTHVVIPGGPQAPPERASRFWAIVGRVFIYVIGAQRMELGSQAAVAAAQGTKFVCDVAEDGEVVLTVLEGEVTFSNALGGVTVRAGEQSTAAPGVAPSRPTRVDPSGFFEWEASAEQSVPGLELRHFENVTREELEAMLAPAQAAADAAPADAGAQIELGDVLADLGEPLAAEAAYRRALAADAANARAGLNLGWVLLAQGRVDEAEEAFAAAAGVPEVAVGLSLCALASGPGGPAQAAEALAQAPADAMALTARGLIALRSGDAPQAVTHLQAAVAADAEAWQAHALLAQALLATGDGAGAMAAAQRAVELAPGAPSARVALATAHFFAGDLATAREQVDLALAWDANLASAWLLSSDIHVAEGDLDAGMRDAQYAVTLDPQLAPAHAALGMILLAEGATKQAERSFERALAADPELVSARTGMGLTYARQGRLAQALDEQKAAIALDASAASAHNNLGAAYLALGELDGAVEEFGTAIELQPDWPMPHANLAIAWLDLNRFAEALHEAELAVELGEESARVYTTLARVHLEQNRVNRAQTALRRAISLDEDYALAHLQMAEVYALQGRPRDAVAHQLEGITEEPAAMLETREYARTEATVDLDPVVDIRRDGRSDDGQSSYFLHGRYANEWERQYAGWTQWSALAIGGRQTAPDEVQVGYLAWGHEERDRPGVLSRLGVPEDRNYTSEFETLDAKWLWRLPAGEDDQVRLKLGWLHQSVRDDNPDAVIRDPKPFRWIDLTVEGLTAEVRWDHALDDERSLIAGVAAFDEQREVRGLLGTTNPPGFDEPVTWQPFANSEDRAALTGYGWYRTPVAERTDLMVGGRIAFRDGIDAVARPEGYVRHRFPPDGTLVLLTRPVLRDDVSELAPVNDWALRPWISPLDLTTGGYSQSWEAVYELAPRDGTILRGAIFHREMRNLIVDLEDPRWAPGVAGQVLASGTLCGGEVEWERPIGEDFSAGIFLRFTDSENDDAGGLEIPFQPEWTGLLRLDYLDEHGTRIGVQWLHIGRRWADFANTMRLGSYNVVNLRMAHQLDLQTDLFLSIDNLLSDDYAFWPGYPADGTRVRGGVQYRF